MIFELTSWSSSLSKYHLKMKVTDLNGDKPRATSIILRTILKFVHHGFFVFIVFYTLDSPPGSYVGILRLLVILFFYIKLNGRRRTLYDYASGTVVLDVQRENVLTNSSSKI